MKNLKIIGISIFALLIFLIFFSTLTNQNLKLKDDDTKVKLNEENYEEVLNNVGSVLKYNGYVYYVKATDDSTNGFNNKICRRKIDEDEEEIIYYAERYKIGKNLIIFNNNLFFNMVGQTYRINLQTLTSVSEYNKGILYYIGDGNLIYAYNDALYKSTYYKETLGIKSISQIATLTPNYMFEDEQNLYFYSDNEDESKSIVSVSKKNQIAQVLDRIYKDEDSSLEVIDYKISDENIYIILKKEKYEILGISKDGKILNSIELENMPQKIVYTYNDNLYFKYGYDSALYKYDLKQNQITKTEKAKKAPDIYNIELIENNIELYKNEEKLCTILENNVKNIEDVRIEEVADYIYVNIEMKNTWNQGEIIFGRIKKDSSEFEKLNNL